MCEQVKDPHRLRGLPGIVEAQCGQEGSELRVEAQLASCDETKHAIANTALATEPI